MNKRDHSARCGNQARTGNEEEITIRENSSRIVDEEEKIINKTSIKSVKKFKLKKNYKHDLEKIHKYLRIRENNQPDLHILQ